MMNQSHSDLWASLKAAEHEFDAACLKEQRLEACDGAGSGSVRLAAASARAAAIEARMTAIVGAMCRRRVATTADLHALARLSLARPYDRRVTDALASAVLAPEG